MGKTPSITFRPITTLDIPLIHEWLNLPHVHEWYEKDRENSLEVVTKEFEKMISGEDPTRGFIFSFDTEPVGYIQENKINDWPAFVESIGDEPHSAAIDIFIGNPSFIGKGYGSRVIKQFLQEVVFTQKGITTCYIDPEPANIRAIRAYEKAGFVYQRTLQVPGEPDLSYLMKITKS